MYIIIRKDKAEHLSEKLHKVKAFACEVLEELELAKEHYYEMEELRSRERSRHAGYHDLERERERYEDPYDEREMARGRGRYSRGRI